MKRDYVGYSVQSPTLRWPNGSRLAVNFVINYEEGAERNPDDGDKILETLTESRYEVNPGDRQLALESFYEFGSRIGIWRLIELFSSYDIRPTIFACALALERNPEVTKALVEHDLDIVGHGYKWIPHYGMSKTQEREVITSAISTISALTGKTIRGWYTRPPQTLNTREVIAEAGLLFDCGAFNDDIPYYSPVKEGQLLIIPYTMDVNDTRFWKGSFHNSNDFSQYCIDAFEYLYHESKRRTRIMSIGLHPRIIGRAGRIGGLIALIDHVSQYEDIWITDRTAIATYWSERFAPQDAWNWPLKEE